MQTANREGRTCAAVRSALYLFYGASVILNGEGFYPEFAVEWVKSAERANVGWFSAYLQYNLPALGQGFRFGGRVRIG